MTPERWKRITEVFYEICELPEEQQPKRLEELCAGDGELKAEIERLLAVSPNTGDGVIDRPPLGDALARFTPGGRRLDVGEVLADRFEIIGHLGSGGMGEVYEAEDRALQHRVAVKLIRRDIAAEPNAIARFRREIALARQVTHRSVCRVFDFFPASPTSRGDCLDFLTMELLRGETLATLMKREAPLSLDRARPILTQIGEALDAAHAAGVLHRDLKGSNIFITDGSDSRVVITDFGLARSSSGGDSVSSGSAWAAGTPLFMSPEQLEGGEVGRQSDIYSLGVLMYQMATGAAPLEGNSPLQIAVKRVKDPPTSPRAVNPNIDPVWESAIVRCLALDPKDRYPSAAALLAALGRERAAFAVPKKALGVAAAVVVLAAGAWWGYQKFSVPALRPEVVRWFREGEVALADGAIAKASKLFELTLRTDPNYLSARCRLAEAYVELDMRDKAQEQILQSMSGSFRNADERLLCEGVKATLVGQWDQAIATAKSRANAQLDEARWNERAGRNAVAAAIYEELIKADGSQPGPLLRLALIRTREAKNTAANALLDRADAAYKTLGNAEGQGEVALARVAASQNVTQAIQNAQNAEFKGQEAGSDWLIVRALLARARQTEMSGDLDGTRKLITEGVERAERAGLAGQAVNGIIDLGYIPFAQGKYEKAEPEFRRALQLAQRYRAQRAEARSRLTLAQLHMTLNQLPQVEPLLAGALEYYRSVGDVVQTAQSLRFRGDFLEKSGKFENARSVYLEALAASPSPADQLQARQRLGFLARQQTRYEEAAERFAEVVEGFESVGNKVSAQGFRIQKANALMFSGRLGDAAKDLEFVRKEKPVNEKVQWQLDLAQSSLDFQELRFDAALGRLESMRLAATKRGAKAEERTIRYELCPKYAEAGRMAQAQPMCENAIREFDGRPAQLVAPHYALAEIYMARREPSKAVAEARKAVAYAEQLNDLRNTWYSLLILTEALHLAADQQWKQARERARAEFGRIATQSSEADANRYLSRPIIARHFQKVERLQ